MRDCGHCEICEFYEAEGSDPERASLAESSVDMTVIGLRYVPAKSLLRLARAVDREFKKRSSRGNPRKRT